MGLCNVTPANAWRPDSALGGGQVVALTAGRELTTRAEIALQGVYELSKILAVPAKLEVTLSNVLALLSSFLEMHRGTIAVLTEDGSPAMVVGQDCSEEEATAYFDSLPERAIGQIVTNKMPAIVDDVTASAIFAGWSSDLEPQRGQRLSFIGVPIMERDRVLGTLTLERSTDPDNEERRDDDVRFLVMIANLIGQTVRLHDIITKDRERLLVEQRRLEKELTEVSRAGKEIRVKGIVGGSKAIRAVIDQIKLVARSNSTVLLRGESGTGKELFARATHDFSSRQNQTFVKLNCAALPESMLESELFGHEKGAFTGAVGLRKGRFELAHGGTLFLDEIGEISPSFQAKLLRVLQEGEFERVGGTKTLKVDVRLVTATNRNLEEAVSRKEFRADLYYRINVVSISLPPLRERPEDIIPLASEFLRRFNDEHGSVKTMSASARRVLEECNFPGNVRELENCVRRTATLARGTDITAEDFACQHGECLSAMLWQNVQQAPAKLAKPVAPVAPPAEPVVMEEDEEGEKARLIAAMKTAGWVQAKAARLLNLTPRQIGYALKKHNIPVKHF